MSTSAPKGEQSTVAMRSPEFQRKWLRPVAAIAVVAIVWFLGCVNNTPTGLGSRLRVHPDSLRILEITTITSDTTFAVPVSMGRSPVVQIGAQYPYRSHILYEFQLPGFVVSGADTLRLDTATLHIHTDSMVTAPFNGLMRIGLQEVAESAKGWSADSLLDSALVELPPLDPEPVARDTVVDGAKLENASTNLEFTLDLAKIAHYDSVRTHGGTLVVSLALVFRDYELDGKGFLILPQRDQLIAFSNDQVEAITTVGPTRRRSVVELDPGYSPGEKLVVSDGYRFHSHVQFDSLRHFLPDSALVFLADLVLTQVDSLEGQSFGIGPDIGVIVPDTTDFTNAVTNRRTIAFRGSVTPVYGTTVTIPVTAYIFDQQEGNVSNRGMLLVLPVEGTQVRHFEFYGSAAPDSLRPRLRIVWGFPAPFEGGKK
jgi:hypothetical protein